MFDTYRMQEHICTELDKKAEVGIKSTTDLDTVWKLTDVYKNLLKIDMLQEAAEEGGNRYSNYDGYSERRHRKRDSMGRYSRSDGEYSERDGHMRAENGTGNFSKNSYNYSERGYSRHGDDPYDRYMDAKHSYASTKAPEHKREMLDALKEDMSDMQEKLQEMMRNSNCREERDIIKTYMDGLSKII